MSVLSKKARYQNWLSNLSVNVLAGILGLLIMLTSPNLLLAHGGSHDTNADGSLKEASKEGVSVDAESLVKKELELVRIDEKVGNILKADFKFKNHKGEDVMLSDLIGKRPVLLSFIYYSCPFFCQYVVEGEKDVIKKMGLQLGKDYDVVTLSFDKKETLENAQKQHQRYAEALDKNGENQSEHWNFLYGNENEITNVTSQLGFYFKWIEANQEFAHTAAVYIISPEGKISRYFYGIKYNPFDLKLAILDAKKEKTKSTTEKLLLYCYRYDSDARGYVLQAKNVMKAGGVATVVFLSGMLGILVRREKKRGCKDDESNNKVI